VDRPAAPWRPPVLAAETVPSKATTPRQQLTSKGTTAILQGAGFSPQGRPDPHLGIDGSIRRRQAPRPRVSTTRQGTRRPPSQVNDDVQQLTTSRNPMTTSTGRRGTTYTGPCFETHPHSGRTARDPITMPRLLRATPYNTRPVSRKPDGCCPPTVRAMSTSTAVPPLFVLPSPTTPVASANRKRASRQPGEQRLTPRQYAHTTEQ